MRATRIITTLQRDRFVYCGQAWRKAAALTALRIPITSPPITAVTFDPAWMEGKPLLYFKLHGYEDVQDWYGLDFHGERPIALTPDLVRQADLTGAIVIAVVCYGAGREMEAAFLEAGAIAFFGSTDEVLAREDTVEEGDLLAQQILSLARKSQNLQDVLAQAKERYRILRGKDLTDYDHTTLEAFTVTLTKGGAHV